MPNGPDLRPLHDGDHAPTDPMTLTPRSPLSLPSLPRLGALAVLLTALLAGAAAPEAQVLRRDAAASDLVANVYDSSVAWGDYTGDGRPDLVVTGRDSGGNPVGEVYRSTAEGTLVRDDAASAVVADVLNASVAWGDYTGDGRPDLVVTGFASGTVGEVYQSTAEGTLVRDDAASAVVADVEVGSVAWGDYTGDGRADLVVTGEDSRSNPVGEVYRSTAEGTLVRDDDASDLIPDVSRGSVAWGDYTGDERPDLVVTGRSLASGAVSEVYRATAEGGLERDAAASNLVANVRQGSVAWGDYTGDRRPDLVVTGLDSGGNGVGDVYQSTAAGTLVRDAAASDIILGVFEGSVAWGDYTGDGRPDLVVTGVDSDLNLVGDVYRSTAEGTLVRDDAASAVVVNVSRSSVAWGDYTGDGRPDLVVTGRDSDFNRVGEVYATVVCDGECFVDASVAASGDGSSWGEAFQTLAEALAASGTGSVIRVAEGTYTPSASDRTASFVVPAGVQIVGGYPAGGAAERDRQPGDGVTDTILSGEIQGNGDLSDNSYHVVRMDTATPITATPGDVGYTRLSGLTIVGGNATGAPDAERGGGLYCVAASGQTCSPAVSDVAFTGNTAQGAGAAYALADGGTASPTFTRVAFSGNTAAALGGAVLAFADQGGTSSPTFTSVTFSGNDATSFGGAFVAFTANSAASASSPTFTNVTFSDNTSDNGGAVVALEFNGTLTPVFTNVTFSGNSATGNGGAVYVLGPGVLTFANTILWGNTAGGSGDQIALSNATATLDHVLLDGGCAAIHLESGAPAPTCSDVLDADPLFTDAASGDLTVEPTSPALNAGDAALLPADTTDLDGDGDTTEPLPLDLAGGPRVLDRAIDLGAFERLVPDTFVDLVVDTDSDDQPYDATTSRAECTDRLLDGDCTLREAIRVANAEAALDRIGFEITEDFGARSGIATISPLSGLPDVTDDDVRLDGYTQPGSARATETTVADIRIVLDGSNTSGESGLVLEANRVVVRGVVVGNFDEDGIRLVGSQSSAITGSYIGTNANGENLGNGGAGVLLTSGTTGTTIGGTDAASRNTIARNGAGGVRVTGATSTSNAILGTVLSDNANLGIGLDGGTEDGFGVTANDADDSDDGPNGLQNYPEITSAAQNGTGATVGFTLRSQPGTYRVELFASATADPSGFGEGARVLGATDLVVGTSGTASGALAVSGVVVGEVVTATATAVTGADTFGGTSEFSAAAAVAVASVTLTGTEGWRMLAAPSTTATVGGFLAPLWTQGFPGADTEAGAANAFRYVESVTGNLNTGYVTPSAGDALPAGVGLFVYVFADDDPSTPAVDGGFPKTIAVSGSESPAPFDFSVSFTDNGPTAADDGWNLLGNPFRAGLDWDAVTRTAVSDAVYVYDPAIDDYLTYTVGAGGSLGGTDASVIAAYQGFWAQATGASPAITAPAAARAAGGAFQGRQRPVPAVVLAVTAEVDGQSLGDEVRVAEVEGAALGVDAADAYELAGFGAVSLDVFAVVADADGALVALDISAVPPGASEVDLDVRAAGMSGAVEVTLTWPEVAVDGPMLLIDRVTGAEVDLRTATEYRFALDAADGPNAARRGDTAAVPGAPRPLRLGAEAGTARRTGASRFALRLGALATDSEETPYETVLGVPRPNPTTGGARLTLSLAESGSVQADVFDVLGRHVASLLDRDLAAGRHEMSVERGALAPGTYVVRVVTGGAVLVRTLTVTR